MLGETGRHNVVPIRGSDDFLAYGSPSISAVKPLEIDKGGPGTPSATVLQSEDQFNAGLYQFHLFVATNSGTKDIWSKTNKDLKAWTMEQDKLRKSPPPPGPMDK